MVYPLPSLASPTRRPTTPGTTPGGDTVSGSGRCGRGSRAS